MVLKGIKYASDWTDGIFINFEVLNGDSDLLNGLNERFLLNNIKNQYSLASDFQRKCIKCQKPELDHFFKKKYLTVEFISINWSIEKNHSRDSKFSLTNYFFL